MTNNDLARRLDQSERILNDKALPPRPIVVCRILSELTDDTAETAAISAKPDCDVDLLESDPRAQTQRPVVIAIPDSKEQLLAALPKLRAFARSLSGRTSAADDLVQETLVKAWARIESFEPGSNMIAWLYTILRNEFYSEFRRRRREVRDQDGVFAAQLVTAPTQEAHIHFLDFRTALGRLAHDHREALILVGASGLSYSDAAVICGCAVGTMKSRVNRARAKLEEMLAGSKEKSKGCNSGWGPALDVAWSGVSKRSAYIRTTADG